MAPRRWHCWAPGAIAAPARLDQRRAWASAATAELRTCLRSLVFAAASLLVGQVDAQVSASVAALSDYRFRGISQSDNNPALQATLAFDHTTGLFASAFASSVDFGGVSDANVETVLAAGYAARLHPDLSWEAGIVYYRYPGSRAARETDYTEGFAGVTWRNVNARFYVTPHYFGGGRSALYAELNATFALSERLAVTAHAGFARITGALQPDRREHQHLDRSASRDLGTRSGGDRYTVRRVSARPEGLPAGGRGGVVAQLLATPRGRKRHSATTAPI